uniref:Integrase catalytic domain-containing protein n=1 Tax=Triticum urartu TaxID=4572 RepID=A0A8R7Q7D9_TRIUA
MGHLAWKCWKRYDESYQGMEEKSANLAAPQYGVDTNWYLDSGATDHITGDLEKLNVRDRYNGNEQIHTASGSGMDIKHIGRSAIHTLDRDLYLNNILHVPESNKSLISASRLAIDNNSFVEIHPYSFCVKDRGTRKVLLQGKGRRGLYPIRHTSTDVKKQVLSATKLSPDRWHRRLGHPSSVIVSKVISQNNLPCASSFNKESVCDACQKGKSHQLPYPKSISESKFPLELVFSDVWGPAVETVGRKQYYVSFIDDFSKFTWIYLIKHKSEVFQKFHDFQKLVERQFDRKILALQTDWGGEYVKLNSFFTKIGISHHVSCPHAHQQNGSAERKHRHIVEVGLSLLAQASMPLKFWDEAFIAATYLINRMPSKVINFETPLERLFHEKPNYSILRIFGCACWPNLRPYNNHKLQFRSKQCTFLGYSNLHKGFKCLDISTGRVYISRDVVFDENVFPFSTLHPNAGARLRAEILLLSPDLLNPTDQGGEHIANDHLFNNPNPNGDSSEKNS